MSPCVRGRVFYEGGRALHPGVAVQRRSLRPTAQSVGLGSKSGRRSQFACGPRGSRSWQSNAAKGRPTILE